MKILGITWLGVNVDDVSTLLPFFRDVMGLRVAEQRHQFVVLDAPNGDTVELFGRGGPQPPHQFARNAIVAGFRVDDIEAARAELERAGIELLGKLEGEPGGYQWQHFRAPDGRTYELTFDPARVARGGG